MKKFILIFTLFFQGYLIYGMENNHALLMDNNHKLLYVAKRIQEKLNKGDSSLDKENEVFKLLNERRKNGFFDESKLNGSAYSSNKNVQEDCNEYEQRKKRVADLEKKLQQRANQKRTFKECK